MENKATRNTSCFLKYTAVLIFVLAAYLFWAIPYRSALSYQEQLQLFQTHGAYFAEHISLPGGMAIYVAEFFVQFFNNYWIGAVIVAMAFSAVQWLSYRTARNLGAGNGMLPFIVAFMPAVMLWIYTGDINHMPTFTASMVGTLAVAAVCTGTKSMRWLVILSLVAIPAAYWLFGPSVIALALIIATAMLLGESSAATKAVAAVSVCLYAVAVIRLSALWTPYPAYQVMAGINYYRMPVTLPALQIAVWAVTAAVIAVCALLPRHIAFNGRKSTIATAAAAVAIIAGAVFGIRASFSTRVYELIDYDYLVRTANWRGIIEKAEKRNPDTKISLSTLNLALAMEGQLDTRAFDFYQHGPDGLIPTFDMDGNAALFLSDLYFQLGLVNTSQRLAFEAMEANPNYRKSSRCIKRLVETNLIRGDYPVAEKYLKLLDNTSVYRKWAARTREMMQTPGAVDSHPLYGKLRRWMVEEDILFSETELDKIMGRLYTSHTENTVARQYLAMYPLMQRDLDKFLQYMGVIESMGPYRPRIVQQGLIMAYVKAGRDVPRGLTDPMTEQQFTQFARTMTSGGKDSAALDAFRGTLWYYLVKGN